MRLFKMHCLENIFAFKKIVSLINFCNFLCLRLNVDINLVCSIKIWLPGIELTWKQQLFDPF